MASIQEMAQFSDKEKATIQKAVNEARNIIPKETQLVNVAGVMTNAQSRVIVLSKTHDWKGRFMANPTNTIGGGGDGTFVHEGATSQGQLPVVVGSKGAVVYVETGNPGKFEKMGWTEIEAKLDKSGNTSSYEDSETGATAAAEIKDFGDKAALIGATFDSIMA
ncbi:Jasmonate-induced protein-like protein [Bienertia sinuspersici]